jgi:hypothetical protein
MVSGDGDLLDLAADDVTVLPPGALLDHVHYDPGQHTSNMSSREVATARLTAELAVNELSTLQPPVENWGLQGWGVEDSNLWPLACRASALAD